ncbi:MAG: hypothetical protein OXL38_01145 [Gammaproteobacteria bacterium]|nr:hypothetical protein [Gammaproteobacteria bacterium]
MSWKEHHRQSAILASEAEQALRGNETEIARELYARAADAEERAVADLDIAKQRTLGISVVSAAALHYKAHDFALSQAVAYAWLAEAVLPDFAVNQLRTLLETIWAEERQDLRGIEFAPQRVLVSAQGGDVIRGGARLDVIVPTMERVLKFLRRTAEMVSGAEFRPRGRQTRFIRDHFRPWVLQTPQGSFQFAVALEQQSRTIDARREPSFQSNVIEQAMAILSATADASGAALHETVSDADYQSYFLRLAYDLAPSGTAHDRLVLRSTGVAADLEVALDLDTRRGLEQTLWPDRGTSVERLSDRCQLVGRLHAVDLKRGWLELTDGGTSHRVTGVSDEFRASVARLVNKNVVVDATREGDRYRLRRIELHETRDRSFDR